MSGCGCGWCVLGDVLIHVRLCVPGCGCGWCVLGDVHVRPVQQNSRVKRIDRPGVRGRSETKRGRVRVSEPPGADHAATRAVEHVRLRCQRLRGRAQRNLGDPGHSLTHCIIVWRRFRLQTVPGNVACLHSNQKCVVSGFEMCFCCRIPPPFGAGGNPRLESSTMKFQPQVNCMCVFQAGTDLECPFGAQSNAQVSLFPNSSPEFYFLFFLLVSCSVTIANVFCFFFWRFIPVDARETCIGPACVAGDAPYTVAWYQTAVW